MAGKKRLFILFALAPAIFLSCGGLTPPPPKPTSIILKIEASRGLNPGPAGHPSPLALRIYELKSVSAFNDADFMSLYRKDRAVLGADLARKFDLIVKPGEKKTVRIEASKDTRAVAAFALFRNYEHAQWKATAGIRPHETTVVRVKVADDGLTLDYPARRPLQKK